MNEFIVWIDRENRIASFHEEAGYERMAFSHQEHFLTYLLELSDRGFRFM